MRMAATRSKAGGPAVQPANRVRCQPSLWTDRFSLLTASLGPVGIRSLDHLCGHRAAERQALVDVAAEVNAAPQARHARLLGLLGEERRLAREQVSEHRALGPRGAAMRRR